MKYPRLYTALFSLFIITLASAFTPPDDGLLSRITNSLSQWLSVTPQEKVYLQLDKPYYASGEDIWFKAYVTTGNRHKLSGYSNVLNVDLIDGEDSVRRRIKIQLTAGLGWGDFALADTLKEGNYRIRAYTNLMRNQDAAYFFDKTITIVNGISNKVFVQTTYSYAGNKVSAAINYTDGNGVPYTGKQVNYRVELDDKTTIKGKGITDDKGTLLAEFTNNSKMALAGRIISLIKLGTTDESVVRKVIPLKALSNKVDVQFFPEGGSMVNGIYSRVGFKSVGADGLGADIKGSIVDDQNQNVADIASSHLGMGSFSIEPEAGRSYKAKLTYADGSQGTVELPKATDNGYVLYVDNSKDSTIGIHVLPGKGIATGINTGKLTLVAQSGGEVFYAGESSSSNQAFTKVISKSSFPSGIMQFTLFSAAGDPLNERLVFIQNADGLKLDVTTAKQSYKPREKVAISLNARDKDDKATIGSFSAAVIDESKVKADETIESTIFSSLLLSSDIKGYIEKPNYYFTNSNAQTRADLDVLMLTQGYHRFEWKQILADKFTPIVYQPEKSLEITGHLKTFGGKPIANGKVTLLSTKGANILLDTLSDADGKFTFKNLVIKDSLRFIIQGRTPKGTKDLDVIIDRIVPQAAGVNINAPDIQVNLNAALTGYIQNSRKKFDEEIKYNTGNHTRQLKEVVVKDVKKTAFDNSSNRAGPGNADQTFTSKDLQQTGMDLVTALQGRIRGVIFKNGVPTSTRTQGAMLIVVDDYPPGSFTLDDINTADIESIEILRSPDYQVLYQGGGNGIIVITTKRRGDADYDVKPAIPGIATFMPKGYYITREFYSPKYDDPKTNAKMQDLRSTIYWNPNILTDKDGNTSMSYFNADAKGTYRVVVEGIDSYGHIGHKIYRYRVE